MLPQKKKAVLVFASLTLALWVATVRLPSPPETALDPSWQEMIVRAFTERWQFGPDFAFTYGPLGFFVGDYHLGAESAGARLGWIYFGQLAFAAATVALLGSIALWRRVLFVAAVAALHSRHWSDGPYVVFIVLVVVRRLIPGDSAWACAGWAASLAALAHVKFSFAVLGIAGAAIATGLAGFRRRWDVALAIPLGGLGAFVALWLVAGQAMANLPPYLVNAVEIIKGYDMMALDEPLRKLLPGTAIVAWCGVVLLLALRKSRDLATIATVAFLAFTWLIIWKHAYTRSGAGHMGALAVTTIYLTVPLATWITSGGKFWTLDAAWIASFAALGLGLLGSWEILRESPARLAGNMRGLALGPGLAQKWENELRHVREREAIPELPALVGRAAIDVYDFDQGIALLQPLNFRPRPVPQGYTVYTPALTALNQRHYRSERAPEFLLWRIGSIDDRLPAQDDAGIYPIVWERYRVQQPLGSHLLLKKEPSPRTWAPSPPTVVRQTLKLGEPLRLPPAAADGVVWIRVNAPPTWLGRLRKMAYKPASLFLHTEQPDRPKKEWRVLPRVATDPGFLLQPVIETNEEFAAFMQGAALPAVAQITFTAAPRQAVFWSHVEVELTLTPRQPRTP